MRRGADGHQPHTKFYEQDSLDGFFTALSSPRVAPLTVVPRFPGPEEYLRVLETIAAESATVTSKQLNLVIKVRAAVLPPSKRYYRCRCPE